MSRKVLVTGGGGFIGSNLVRGLLERGDTVRVLDNFATGNRDNLDGRRRRGRRGRASELRARPQRRPRSRGRLPSRRARLGAALGAGSADDERRQRRGDAERAARRTRRGRSPRRLRLVLVRLRLCGDAARAGGVTRSIRSRRTGSRSSPPSATASAFSRVYESFETVVLRYFNVFGPRQSPHSQYAAVVPLFLTAIAAGEPLTIFGDGEQSRDFTYVQNVVEANLRAAEAERGERADLQRRRRVASEREHARRDDRRAARQAGRAAVRATARRRPARLLGGHLGRTGDPRLGAGRRLRGRAPPNRRMPRLSRLPADPRPARDRAPEHGRPGAPRRLPLGGARRARLRDDARRRLARARRGLDGVRRGGARRRGRQARRALARDLARSATRSRCSGSPG